MTDEADPRHKVARLFDQLAPDEVAAALAGNRGEDGLLHLTQQVRYTIGRAA